MLSPTEPGTSDVFCQPSMSWSAARCSNTAARGPACATARGLSAGSPGSSTQPQDQAVAYRSLAGLPPSAQLCFIDWMADSAPGTSDTKVFHAAFSFAVSACDFGP